MEEREDILKTLMESIGEEGCGVSCKEAEVFKDEEGWKLFLEGFMEPWFIGKTVDEAKGLFEEFQRLDLRVGTVRGAEAIPGSKKLIKLEVDIGEERTVVAGIAGHYAADDLVGKQVVIVANLAPAKLMGVESNGMILAAEDKSGVHLLIPDVETDPGSRVR